MLNQQLFSAFSKYHDKPAFIGHHGHALSFANLNDIADRLAGQLYAFGIRPNSRVHIDIQDAELKIAMWLAVWRLGADLLAGNALDVYAKFKLAPDLSITDQDNPPDTAIKFDEAWLTKKHAYKAQTEPGTIYFTTNATSRDAHIVGVDAQCFWTDIENYRNLLGPAKGTFFFYSSLDSFRTFRDVVRAFLEGQAVIGPHASNSVCWKSIYEQDVAEVFVAPLMLRHLLDAYKNNPQNHKIKRIFVASGTAQVALLEEASACLKAEIGLASGVMECSLFSYLVYNPETYRMGQIGQMQNGIEARILDGDGQISDIDCTGSLQLRVPIQNRFQAYVNADSAWDADGWFGTGFRAAIDVDGCITKQGREDDRINLGGLRLFSAQVEEVVLQIPEIQHVAAIRVFADNGAETLGLAIELNSPLSPSAIATIVKKGLPSASGVQVALVEKLPVNAAGIPDRKLIQNRWADIFEAK